MEKDSQRPEGGKFIRFDHCHFWVGNAKQAAGWYAAHFGFEFYAYKGLETGSRDVATHVIRSQNTGVVLAFSSPYTNNTDREKEMNSQLSVHGDGVKDIAFEVDNCQGLYDKAISRGGVSVLPPTELKDENGSVWVATVKTYGDTHHTLIQRNGYTGVFLPGFIPHFLKNTMNNYVKPINFEKIDHIVGNQPDLQMKDATGLYEKLWDFHQFWSVDDSIMHTDYSALRSIVMTDFDEVIKMPINEPANGKRKSQIQEFVDYYGGAGAQHIALKTDKIIDTIENMRDRGVEFLTIPDTYYDLLRKNLSTATIKVHEDIEALQKNKILVDYDEKGYLLQIFTKPVEDRPTLFYEIIQRHNHQGFGAGNFKSLFVSIELEQERRGNLN